MPVRAVELFLYFVDLIPVVLLVWVFRHIRSYSTSADGLREAFRIEVQDDLEWLYEHPECVRLLCPE